jgi:cellulose synthase/poly-beta-1,6-N-acetylglucosamine synthase-like glycosyltransferase
LGKGDVLNQGIRESKNEIIIVFDADYTPAPDTIKRLVRWFDDPKIGLVQGKIHVVNKDMNLLTKMINTERCAGFLCDLAARDQLKISNQYGGTAGGFRRELISKVGEWETETYCEDTDLTCRALLAGYKIKYDVTVNCGEEAPDSLKVYYKQRYRWIRGHTICGLKYTKRFLKSSFLSTREKIDTFFWININLIPIFGVAQYFLSPNLASQPYSIVLMIVSAGATAAMVFAGLYQIKQLRYLKFAILMIISSFLMCFSVSIKVYLDILSNSPFKWTKTERSGNVR